jgi:hypothetical protein
VNSPYINRFIQPDTITPGGPQGRNRYSYVINNPINRIDPSGHDDWSCETASCSYNYYNRNNYSASNELAYIKARTKQDYGVTLDDNGATNPNFKDSHGSKWDLTNARIVDSGLNSMNKALNGNLHKIIGSATFTLNSHPDAGHYKGLTPDPINSNNIVDFYTNSTIPFQNLYHEFGHVLDNSTGDAFTTPLGTVHSSDSGEYWFGGNGTGFLSSQELFKSPSVGDPFWTSVSAIQDNKGTANEQWGDLWANYVAGNIDQSKVGGSAAYTWMTTQLTPYIGAP